jgi:glycine oxidase
LDNRELLGQLATAIRRLGATWHELSAVEQVQPGLIRTWNDSYRFDLAIDARGFGAKPQFPHLRGVRGEVLWVYAPEVALTRPVRLMHPRYQLYIAPKRDSVYVIGATEIESESLAPITVRSSLELQSALYSVHTGFAEANVLHAYANCRPAFMDNLPRIDSEAGLLRVNGLYRHGYLLGPLVLQLALAALDGDVVHPIVHSENVAQVVNL